MNVIGIKIGVEIIQNNSASQDDFTVIIFFTDLTENVILRF